MWGLDAVSFVQLNARGAFTKPLRAIKTLTVATFTVLFGTVGYKKSWLYGREDLANAMGVSRKAAKTISARGMFQRFFAD